MTNPKLVFLAIFALAFGQEDKITSLPGFNVNNLGFSMYSGYLEVNSDRQLFYWFVESEVNPTTDPLVLWLNGGPGCSSLDGLFSEHGPLHFNDDGSLFYNPYSWNKVANMLYLESPAGVGFSYSDDGSIVLNDAETAENAYAALKSFFEKFPQFKKNDFYVSGESYAGHYVPQLSYRILLGNKVKEYSINMKGLLVGNGVTDNWFDSESYLEFIYNHAFVSEAQFKSAAQSCSGNFVNNTTPACQNALTAALNNMNSINPYNIYDVCISSPSVSSRPHPLSHLRLGAQIPCINSTVETNYLNRNDVKSAIHANSKLKWTVCNIPLNEAYNRDDSVLQLYTPLMGEYRVLIYSGDVDSSVNYKGTQQWINYLNLPVMSDWKPWMIKGQVGGFKKEFKKLTFLTIRGAGHMVPQYKPAESLEFFSKWMKNQPF